MAKDNPGLARKRRHVRVRKKVTGTSEAPRLCVFRSLNHIYAQVIDDTQGSTLVSASTALEKAVRSPKIMNSSRCTWNATSPLFDMTISVPVLL